MKKLFAIITLLFVTTFALTACTGTPEVTGDAAEYAISGRWESAEGSEFIFNDDHTVVLNLNNGRTHEGEFVENGEGLYTVTFTGGDNGVYVGTHEIIVEEDSFTIEGSDFTWMMNHTYNR
jgi:hypothetical protein